jgi:hypothetical protein
VRKRVVDDLLHRLQICTRDRRARGVIAGLETVADVGDQRAVDADQGVGDDVRPQVAGAGARVVGDQLRESVGVPGQDLPLAGERRRTAGDESRQRDQLRDIKQRGGNERL